MTDEYYVLMNDCQNNFYSGVLDTECAQAQRVEGSSISFPYDVGKIQDNIIYWNFEKVENLSFDYRCEKGHILSEKMMDILSGFVFSPHYKKRLSVWMRGAETQYSYTYIAFERGVWKTGKQLDPDFIFYDRLQSSYELNKRGGIIPSGEIKLTENAEKYDVFELLDTTYLGGFLVVNNEVKRKIESEKNNVRGFKVVPLNDAFNTYCRDYNISVEMLRAKAKRKIP
ncbi:Imm43 family immunity protein [Salinivibrio sp. ML290]|uniref:Imm43 family immunity protein n=1 Tax=Salinivibrio sp. ML290 TaxID=1909468 RepID=UPI00098862A0|nr:Imm43 family immunity protein [Salinivibrio sp. ML290]OOE71290.1 hypothetical protein BZG23_16315 [Salinivibrio sp. ML290]